jgi:hypothetical protein
MARPALPGPSGEDSERQTIRFVGGPWDGDAVRCRVDHERCEVNYRFCHDRSIGTR